MPNPKPYALITGASNGIGYELARLFAEDGYNIIMVANNKSRLDTAARVLAAELKKKTKIETISADLSKTTGAQKVFDAVKERKLNVSVLVNNAGAGVYGKFAENDIKEELATIQLNSISVVQLTKLFLPEMLKRRHGKILITSSVAALTSLPFLTIYAATKAFLYNFAEGLREEVKDSGITVTALMPGATDTGFFARSGAQDTNAAQGKLADPADVAKAGFQALKDGKDHVIAPLSAKVLAGVTELMPQRTVAHMARVKKASNK